jgi:hypothetical protein
MSFGSNYYPVYREESKQLESGDYTARITGAVIKEFPSKDEYVEVTVEIDGYKGCKPDKILLSEAPVLGATKANGNTVTKEDVDKANGKITRFFQCFGIKDGNFNILQWKGKTGTVHCDWQYDKNEPDQKSKKYKQLFPKVTDATSAPKAPVQATEEFKEDFPIY